MQPEYSFVIPVFNRPDEIRELLQSMLKMRAPVPFEVVIVEDGSTKSSETVVAEFQDRLEISYYFKTNSGPGDSRNFGMRKARAPYYLILDSDVLMPEDYLEEVHNFLSASYYDCFGGPDAAHHSFSNIQKAIDYSMTSLFTTGGIRGGKKAVDEFQPRSFNMGLSEKAFELTNGFGRIHPGEDPDLSLRLKKLGMRSCLIPNARVFHKRRIDWKKFFLQVKKFGMVRPILNQWHPGSSKITYWFPTLFMLGLIGSIVLLFAGFSIFIACYLIYFLIVAVDAAIRNKSLYIGLLAVRAVIIQFSGYGYGFLVSNYRINIQQQEPEVAFPQLFFKKHGNQE